MRIISYGENDLKTKCQRCNSIIGFVHTEALADLSRKFWITCPVCGERICVDDILKIS